MSERCPSLYKDGETWCFREAGHTGNHSAWTAAGQVLWTTGEQWVLSLRDTIRGQE